MTSTLLDYTLPENDFSSSFLAVPTESDTMNLIVGTYSGRIITARYQQNEWSTLSYQKVFKKPVRRILSCGDYFLCASASGAVALLDREIKILHKKILRDSENVSIDISVVAVLDGSKNPTIAVGDDYGNVYIFHYTESAWVNTVTVQEQDDSITGIIHCANKKTLLASSADGTILVFDLKKMKIVAHTTSLDDEILSMTLDADCNVVCSTGLGAIVRYKWGFWGKVSTRLKPVSHQSSSVNFLIPHPADLKIAVSGTINGVVRFVSLGGDLSVKHLLFQFDDSVENLQSFIFSHKPHCAISLSNDNRIMFRDLDDVAILNETDIAVRQETSKAGKAKTESRNPFSSSFFDDLSYTS